MKRNELREIFLHEEGIKWENEQGEPDIDYVLWLENLILNNHNIKSFN